jgi:3-isopropylmalate/(R)-2-methylmalate dehydratase small subunit
MKILPTVSESSSKPFVRHMGIAAPLLYRDLAGTDIAANDRDDSESPPDEEGAFEPLEYLLEQRTNPDSVLSQERYRGASILLFDRDAGMGSVSPAAVSLPATLGIRVVVAPCFGPFFLSEAEQQGILLAPFTGDVIERIADWVQANPRVEIIVDLQTQLLELPGMEPLPFVTDPRLRHKLLYGLGDMDELRQYSADALAFRKADRARRPWLYDQFENT